jgi:hypothetical protein
MPIMPEEKGQPKHVRDLHEKLTQSKIAESTPQSGTCEPKTMITESMLLQTNAFVQDS